MSHQKLLFTTFALLFLLSMLVDDTYACSCLPSHPQSSYCNAEYVIVARVLRKSNRKINNHHIYKIDIVRTYKASEKAQQYLKQSRLITAPSDGLCGYTFKIGQLYAIAGNSQKVGLCQYIKEYDKMTHVEKRGMAGAYKKGCGCEINLCMNNRGCESAPKSCEWSLFNDCETDFGICAPVRLTKSASRQPKCQWRRNDSYKACLLDP